MVAKFGDDSLSRNPKAGLLWRLQMTLELITVFFSRAFILRSTSHLPGSTWAENGQLFGYSYRRRKTYKMNSVISEILFSVESSSESVYWCLILSIKKKQIKGFYWPFLAIDTTNGSSICIFNSWIVLMLIKGIALNENGPLTVSFGSLVTFFSIILLLSVFVIPCNILLLICFNKMR